MRLISAFLFIVIVGSVVCAQSTSGTLVGAVTDASGLLVSGVSVTVIESSTNSSRSVETNEAGGYSIPGLAAGTYRVEFRKDRFKIGQSQLDLRLNETQRLDAVMTVGPIDEFVSVQATTPLLQTDTFALGNVIEGREIDQYPVSGRQLENLLKILPGVIASAPNSHLSSRGGLNAGGLDEHYLSLLVDGLDDNDPVIRSFNYKPPLEFIEAIRLEQNGYSSQFGRNAGAIVNVTTKSGTNTLHANAWGFLRNDNVDARNVFSVGTPKPPLIRNQFGGTLGGTFKPDKTFFFIGAEILRQKMGMVRRATVPTDLMRQGILIEFPGPVLDPQNGNQPFPGNVIPDSRIHPLSREVLAAIPRANRPGIGNNRIELANRIDNGFDFSGRVDHQLTTGTRVMGRYSANMMRILDPFRIDTTGASNLSVFGQTADRFRTNIALSAVTVKGRNLVNEFRAGFSRFRQPQLPVNPGTPGQAPLMGFAKTFLNFRVIGMEPWGSNAEFQRAVNVYNYTDAATYVRGNHQYRFGVDARRYLFNAYNVSPNILIFAGARSANPMGDFLLGLPFQIISFNGEPYGNTRKFEFAGYAEDDWKVNPRLTLNFGLRWEFYGRITEKINEQSVWAAGCACMQIAGKETSPGLVDNDWNNLAPRLGLAWRPFGERTVVRASAGIFYDNDARHNTEFFTNPPFFETREFTFPASLSDPFNAASVGSTLRPNALDKKFRDTYVEQWNLNVQQEVAQGLLVEVAYLGNHSLKARRLRNLNQPFNGVTPYPGFGTIFLAEQAGSSSYNALQIRVERRFSRGLGFLSSYTWGHAIDDRPGQGSGPSQNYYDMRAERASSDFDVRHNWVVSGSYELPIGRGTPWGGWSLNAISTVQSGRPFTVTQALTQFFTAPRPNVVPGVDWRPTDQSPDRWINASAFSGAPGFGNLGRNTLTGPGFFNIDFSIVKTHRFRDGTQLQFRTEFFNILNHPNFGLPSSQMGPTLGLISSTASPERQIQFGAKVGF